MWIPCDSPAQADPHQARITEPLIQLLDISWWGRQEQHGNHFHHNHCKILHLMWWVVFSSCCSVLFFSSLMVLFVLVIQRDLPALPRTDSCVKCSLHLCVVPKRHRSTDDKSEEEGEGFYGLQKSHSKGGILAAMERWFYFLFLISGKSFKAEFLFRSCLSLPNVRFWFKVTCFVPLFMFTL